MALQLLCLITLSLTVVANNAQTTGLIIHMVSSVDTSDLENLGFVLQVICGGAFPVGTTNPKYKLLFEGQLISINNELVSNSTRYSLRKGGYVLAISNVVKEDEGTYECRFEYTYYGGKEVHVASQMHHVVTFTRDYPYLPSLQYPECNYQMTENGTLNQTIMFDCTVGESTADIDVQLGIKRSDGLEILLGNNSAVSLTVTDELHRASLFCIMTSPTYPTANRSCSAGPILLHPDTELSSTVVTKTEQTSLPKYSTDLLPTSKVTTSDSADANTFFYSSDFPGYITAVVIAIIVISVSLNAFLLILLVKLYHVIRNRDNAKSTDTIANEEIYQEVVETHMQGKDTSFDSVIDTRFNIDQNITTESARIDDKFYMELTESNDQSKYTDLKEEAREVASGYYEGLKMEDVEKRPYMKLEVKEQYEDILPPSDSMKMYEEVTGH